ncbi:colanic acid biosynthesis glycosyl transferase WcaI [Catalinimonas alkaloidigena]|uniref:WcaI family glycosyltransferase n=1 Tax=Catalinimonas alkaloidigena TaxID=1075417 RepID=UPI002404CDC4|nr:WcaI family glycosyltransferase [Catalinimonas alkaloidigena]MDF9799722.1 colanic acid biosynthesis glycosyl transferase WcaI [Catalinimonas alkaloidigena]
MRILVYGINYYPELTGIGKYTTEMCEWLTRQGHQIEVISALPYYPEWDVHEDYKGKGWHSEVINGVRVHRGPFYVPKNVSGYTRLLHEFSFLASSAWSWMKQLPRNFDLVLCIYPPLPIGVFPLLCKWLKGTPFVFHIQDLQVDAARQLGIIRRKGLLNFLEGFERYFMRRADLVTTISEGMRKKVLAKGVAKDRLKLFPNWVDTQRLFPYDEAEKPGLKQQYGYQPGDKIVLYSGNLGEKQGLDSLLRAAAIAQEKQSELKFFVVGEGAAKKSLLALKEELRLENVRFAPLVPKKELPDLLNMADLHVILQKKGATDLVMPSKLGGILACGGVPLVAAEERSSLRRLIEEHRMGVLADAENELSLLYSIEQYFAKRSQVDYSAHARQYARQYLCIDSILTRFESDLAEVGGQLMVGEPIIDRAEA